MIIFVGSFFIFLILKFSSFKVDIKNLKKESKEEKVKYNISLKFYLFGFLKVFGMSFLEKKKRFLFFEFKRKKENKTSKHIFFLIKNFKIINAKIDKLKIIVNVGFEEMGLTVLSVFGISTLISILLLRENTGNSSFEDIYYEVNPVYNGEFFSFSVQGVFSIKLLDFIKFIYAYKKPEIISEKSSIFA